jgi:PAS domain S-box-containing protein
MRRTGIEVIGDVPWGTHFCQFYETARDLVETLVPYFREGLEQNEFCMWVTAAPLQVKQAKAALRAAVPDLDRRIEQGQIEILDYREWYLPSGKFHSEEVLQAWVDKLNSARERGFEGLRLTGNTFWLEEAGWKDFTEYEAAINSVIGRYRMLALCTYSLRKCGATEIMDVIANHQFALIKRRGQWEIIESPEHKKTQQALRESEEQYRSLFNNMTEGFALHEIITDEEGRPSDYRFLDINPAFETLTGLDRGAIRGRRVREVLPAIEPFWIESYGKVALTGEPTHFENYYPEPLNRWYEVFAYSPAARRFAAIFTDITARKKAEETLRLVAEEEKLRLAAAVEQASESVVMAGLDGLIMYVNAAFEGINGRRKEQSLGKSYFEFLTNEPQETAIRDAFRRGGQWTGRLTRRVGEGDRRELDVAISPVRDQTGRILSFLVVERDITREVKLQQHLRQAQKAEALGTLAGGIAHDFNNVLSTIAVNSELALMELEGNARSQSPLPLVLQAVQRGKELVQQIITFSRRREHERKPMKISPVLKETLKLLRSSLPPTIEIQEDIMMHADTVLADPSQIHQILVNLCNNAAYAMREEGGKLSVRMTATDVDAAMSALYPDLKPGPYVRLTVGDSGAGMSPEVMDRMFDPFFTTKRPGEGSGLGLSVVQGIVKSYGGTITAYSKVGQGSTFSVFLPRIEGEPQPKRVPPEKITGGKERILVVEDEEAQLESYRNALQKLGYEVVARTSSAAALADFRSDPDAFDLVITDQAMPQMTGARLAEEMLRIRPSLPIVLCTGFSEVVNGEAAGRIGIREFLMKPFSIGEVAGAVRRALGEEKS